MTTQNDQRTDTYEKEIAMSLRRFRTWVDVCIMLLCLGGSGRASSAPSPYAILGWFLLGVGTDTAVHL